MRIFHLLGFHNAPEPAANKWLSVWPILNNIGAMQAFHGIFIFALRYACDVATGEMDSLGDPADVTEDELVGAPLSSAAWHRRERRRDLKALAWAESRSGHFLVALFCFLAAPVMVLHYKFFKHATSSPYGNDRSILFDLSSEHSPTKDVLRKLASFLSDTATWQPLEAIFGPVSRWDPDRRKLSRELTEQLIGEVQRRVQEPFEKMPYLKYLPPIADPSKDEASRLAAAHVLFAADERGLDKACLKLRRRAGVPGTLLEPFWRCFLFHAMNKIPVASALVELMFGAFTNWLRKCLKPIHVSLLAAKQCNHSALQALQQKRVRAAAPQAVPVAERGSEPRKRHRPRPVWILKRGDCARRNGFHLFTRKHILLRQQGETQHDALRASLAQWKALPPAEKLRWGLRAQKENKASAMGKIVDIQSAAVNEHGPSPWGIADGCTYPISPIDIVEVFNEKAGVATRSDSWRSAMNIVVGRCETFPNVVKYRKIIPFPLLAMDEHKQKAVLQVIRALQIIFGARGLGASRHRTHTSITRALCIQEATCGKSTLIVPCSLQKNPAFKLWSMRWRVAGNAENWSTEELPYDVVLASFVATTELQLAAEVVEQGFGPYAYRFAEVDDSVGKPLTSMIVRALGPPIDLGKLEDEQREQACTPSRCKRYVHFVKSSRCTQIDQAIAKAPLVDCMV